jgi:hypothetical protein
MSVTVTAYILVMALLGETTSMNDNTSIELKSIGQMSFIQHVTVMSIN